MVVSLIFFGGTGHWFEMSVLALLFDSKNRTKKSFMPGMSYCRQKMDLSHYTRHCRILSVDYNNLGKVLNSFI